MQRAKLLLVIAAVLFAGWLGWLAYLALTSANPIVLSRPQFLVSTLDVIAKVEEDEAGNALPRITEPDEGKDRWIGRPIRVVDLPELGKKQGWKGAGDYILPLQSDGEYYWVARIPASPGYPVRSREEEFGRRAHLVGESMAAQNLAPAGVPIAPFIHMDAAGGVAVTGFVADSRRIYPLTKETRKQLDNMPKSQAP